MDLPAMRDERRVEMHEVSVKGFNDCRLNTRHRQTHTIHEKKKKIYKKLQRILYSFWTSVLITSAESINAHESLMQSHHFASSTSVTLAAIQYIIMSTHTHTHTSPLKLHQEWWIICHTGKSGNGGGNRCMMAKTLEKQFKLQCAKY